MATNLKPKFTCYLLSGKTKDFQIIVNNLNEVLHERNGELIYSKKSRKNYPRPYELDDFDLIANADLVLAIVNSDVDISYEIGAAHALGKPVIFIKINLPQSYTDRLIDTGISIEYKMSSTGTIKFKNDFRGLLDFYFDDPLAFKLHFSYFKKIFGSDFFIDIDKLEPREYENLCFELISQMGFRKVDWGLKMKEIDMVATLPKKDPDGFEYEELWLIVTGKNSYPEHLLERLMFEPEYIFDKILHSEFFFKNKFKSRSDIPITILFILREDKPGFFSRDIEETEERFRHRKYPMNIRIRTWDANYLIKLIQTYPQIVYKYFSDLSPGKLEYRKTSKELYTENIALTEDILRIKKTLEEEKKKRFIAERETAWKDVAFIAAHKLGNTIDAADTFLQSMKRKLNENDIERAINIADKIDLSIEKSKTIIEQFKSIEKTEEIIPQHSDIIKIIRDACKTADEKGIEVTVNAEPNLPEIFVDPNKIEACFSELFANALKWFDKPTKFIRINIKIITNKEMPEPLDEQKEYLQIIFKDNGVGISYENKEKIFSPFITTDPHGSGLGLSYVKKIIEKHEGWIVEDGKPGEGASFIIYLPIFYKK